MINVNTDAVREFLAILTAGAIYVHTFDQAWHYRIRLGRLREEQAPDVDPDTEDYLKGRIRSNEDRHLRYEGWFAGYLFANKLDMPSGHQEIMGRVIMDSFPWREEDHDPQP